MTINSGEIRSQFPSLKRQHQGNSLIFLDGPGGTQVPESVINAISGYYKKSNANSHGAFVTAHETDQVIDKCRTSVCTLLSAESPDTISIGQNMTSLNYSLSRAIGRILNPGDEILITQLDHESNRGPWLALRELGIKVNEVNLLKNGLLDYADFEKKMNSNTRLVAMGMASNAIGTVNDITWARAITYKYNAWLLLDAVHYAPHFAIDVRASGCDFLLCSAYKFYGPHVGLLYTKPGLLDRLPTDRLRTTNQMAPYSIETGTLNHAAIAGVTASIEFISHLGSGKTLREKIISAYSQIGKHENKLAQRLYNGLKEIPGLSIIGQPFGKSERSPTISFTLKNKKAEEVCQHLASKNICAWDGHFYAIRVMEVLGLLEGGGVTRMGISIYNTEKEIDATIKEVKSLVK